MPSRSGTCKALPRTAHAGPAFYRGLPSGSISGERKYLLMHEQATLTDPTVMGLLWLFICALSLYLSAVRPDAAVYRMTGAAAVAAFLITINGLPAVWQFLLFFMTLCIARAVRTAISSIGRHRFRRRTPKCSGAAGCARSYTVKARRQ